MLRTSWPIWRALFGGAAALALLIGSVLWLAARGSLGAAPEGERLARIHASPQWRDGAFRNVLPRVDGPVLRMAYEFVLGGSDYRTPTSPIPVVARDAASFTLGPTSGLRATWLGHSTMLLELEGHRILIDPVWGERTSPFSFMGPTRFFAPPLPLNDLPSIDAVVISHDHYDHLDTPTVKALAALDIRFVVPLGVGAHLEAWGVAPERITELDWWESTDVSGLTLTATPARHFSGRSLTDDAMIEIGTRLGPFDLTMIEVGAYDALWADVHLGPEQAVLAHQLVGGDVMLPVHWRLFDLALHGWTEPMDRVLVEAERVGVRVAAPRPGESVEPALWMPPERWWPQVPWQSVLEAPVYSSHVEQLIEQLPPLSPASAIDR